MKALTVKQRAIWDFVKSFYQANKHLPTYRVIGDHFDISVKGAFDHVHAIEKKGFNTGLHKKPYRGHHGDNDPAIVNRIRRYTKSLINDGLLIPAPCMVCGCQKAEAHHEDYTDATKILWLCKEHHRQWHHLLKISQATIQIFNDYYSQ
jgi:hypothetical protein